MDFEKIVRKFVNDDGNIVADSIQGMVQAIAKSVGENFVTVDRYNTKKSQVDELQSKIESSEKAANELESLRKEYEGYRNDVEAKKVRQEKESAYKEMLKEIGIPEKRHNTIIRTVDFDGLSLKDGKVSEEDKKGAKDEWADFIVSAKETGVQTANPPANNGGKTTMTKEQIMGIRDSVARQRAIAENAELFGLRGE